jgi:hypothetical protein
MKNMNKAQKVLSCGTELTHSAPLLLTSIILFSELAGTVLIYMTHFLVAAKDCHPEVSVAFLSPSNQMVG